MDIQYDFSGQTAIVTGGARGIGRAIAEQFVRFGAQVWIWDIDPVELDGAHSLTVDVTSADEIARALVQMFRQSPHIEILVNNAGYLGRRPEGGNPTAAMLSPGIILTFTDIRKSLAINWNGMTPNSTLFCRVFA
jgi:NAD(P)-dependent dehydrogenase (short-subunit alcohol dehydrogenase family)